MAYNDEKDDSKLLDDLSSALLSGDNEDPLINFTALRRGLGIHQITKKGKGYPVEFRINEIPGQDMSVPATDKIQGRVLSFFQRFSSLCIDGAMILIMLATFYAMTIIILIGDLPADDMKQLFTGYTPILLSKELWLYASLIFLMIWFCYLFIFQSITGSTPGKLICGLKTVSRKGGRAKFSHLITARTRVVRFATT